MDDRQQVTFVDGQRLSASDLRAEHDYHVGVRRLMNRALCGARVISGLTVSVKPGDSRTVVVAPGVALDDRGRELILRAPREMAVRGVPSTTAGTVYGNYLAAEYAEHTVAGKVRSVPRLSWLPVWPRPGSRQVVLAQVELAADCTVRRINATVRETDRGRTRGSAVVAIAGADDVAADTPRDIRFQVRGARPRQVALYLRGAVLSSLYYTQLGGHTHPTGITLSQTDKALKHTHAIAPVVTSPALPDPRHQHNVTVWSGTDAAGVNEWDKPPRWNDQFMSLSGLHHHRLPDMETGEQMEASWSHGHTATAQVDPAGVTDAAAASGIPLRYVAGLRVRVDSADVTDAIVAALVRRDGSGSWAALGDGSPSHPLVTPGTGEIDLVELGVDLALGEHRVELSVPAGGGRIIYNLYLES